MQDALRSIWADISSGKNIVAYLLIVAAIVLPALNIAGVVTTDWMLRLVLPTLGLLLAGNILNRRLLAKIADLPPEISVGVHQSWGSGEVYRALAGARESVVIVTSWVIDSAVLGDHIRRAAANLKTDLSVDVYMLDPKGPLGALRYAEIFPETKTEELPSKYKLRFEEAVADFRTKFKTVSNVKVKFSSYASMPEIKLFVVDKKHYFFSWLVADGASTDNVCLHVSSENLSEDAQLVVAKLRDQLRVIQERSSAVEDV